MSNLKHTPGVQWFISPNSSCSIVDENGVLVADLAAETDARLIAAAPEMLKVLIDVYDDMGELDGRISAVIEKATGMTIEEVLK